MSQLGYCEKPVLLDRATHRRMRVQPSASFAFTRDSNCMYLAGVEFNQACKDYAIVFARLDQQKIMPVALLGLRERENLFVDEQQRWTGGYIPAFVRRYPFVLAQLPGQALGLCVDEAFAGWNESVGEALFDAQGQDTPYLRNALDFLQRYQHEYARTETFCQRLEQAGLLMEMNARADLLDGRSFTLNGLLVVDEAKLMALPDAQVLALFRAGELHLISMHLASLTNMQKLIDRMAVRAAALSPVPLPP